MATKRNRAGRVLLAGAILCAVLFATYAPIIEAPDSPSYLAPARSWAGGEGLRESDGSPLAYRLPLYPLTLGASFRLFGDSARVVGGLNVALLILAGLLVRRAVVAATSPFIADLAAAVTILYPPLLSSTALVLQEVFLAFLVTMLFLFTREALVHRSGSYSFLAGAALGACALGKTTALASAPFLILLAVARGRDGLKRGALLGLAAMIVLSPWVVRNWLALGRFEIGPGNAGHALLGGTVSNNIENWYDFPEYQTAVSDWRSARNREWPVLDRYLTHVAFQRIMDDPLHWLRLCGERVGRFMLPARTWFVHVGLAKGGTFPPVYVLQIAFNLVLFALCARMAIRALRKRDEVLALGPAIVFSHMLVYAATYVSPRYALTITPVLIATSALRLGGRGHER